MNSHRLPLEMYAKHCAKPCYDCPFTRAGAAYMSPEEMADNVHRTLHEKVPQHCHHSVMDTSEGLSLPIAKAKPRVCGGNLVLMRRLGITPIDGPVPLAAFFAADDIDGRVVDSIEELVRIATRYCRLPQTRYWLWWGLQPANVRLRIAEKGRKSYADAILQGVTR